MTQFSSKTLGRLLANVDRETLVNAIAEEDLWSVFGSTEREALIELAGIFNAFANLKTFFLDNIEAKGVDFLTERAISFLLGQLPPGWGFAAKVLFEIYKTVSEISTVDAQGLDIPTATSRLTIVISGLSTYLRLPHELYHPTVEADGRLISIQGHAEAALRALGVPI